MLVLYYLDGGVTQHVVNTNDWLLSTSDMLGG